MHNSILENLYQLSKADYDVNYDFISKGQIDSKQWLMNVAKSEQFIKEDDTIFIMAGWYGFLATMILSEFKCKTIRSFDVDPNCSPIADVLNNKHVANKWKFKSVTADILNLNWDKTGHCKFKVDSGEELYEKPDLIINTSCEHIANFGFWLDTVPKGTRVILQGNDFDIPEHVNRILSDEHFIQLTSLSTVLYNDNLYVPEADYTRYMIVGIK